MIDFCFFLQKKIIVLFENEMDCLIFSFYSVWMQCYQFFFVDCFFLYFIFCFMCQFLLFCFFVCVVCVLFDWFFFVVSSALRQPLLRRHHFREQLRPPWISFLVWGLSRRQRLQQRRFLQRLFALRLLGQLLNRKKQTKKNNRTNSIIFLEKKGTKINFNWLVIGAKTNRLTTIHVLYFRKYNRVFSARTHKRMYTWKRVLVVFFV